jgi:hypothetical protein
MSETTATSLPREGQNTTAAQKALATFREAQTLHVQHRDYILDELSRLYRRDVQNFQKSTLCECIIGLSVAAIRFGKYVPWSRRVGRLLFGDRFSPQHTARSSS